MRTAHPRMTVANLTILDAMAGPHLFGRMFDGPSWAPWRAFLDDLTDYVIEQYGEESEP